MAKARGGRGPTRMDKRRQAEAAEARERDEEPEVEEEDDDGDDDEEGGKKKKKPAKKKAPAAKKPAVKKPATKRSRTAKEVRRRAVWVVYDNASKEVDEFPFNKKGDAEALLAKKIQEKEGKATFYLNLVKKEIKE